MRGVFVDQVRLLVRCLPIVGRRDVFALKGGTAINLFHRNLPRLSVDIDLTFLPVLDREESLDAIRTTLEQIAAGIGRAIPGSRAELITAGAAASTRVVVTLGNARIKIETSPVTRGTCHPTETKRVSPRVEDEFGFAEANTVSFLDLFAGKIVAALDRQHPRDLFDVMLLQADEGISDEMFRTFLVYVASSPRPTHEILDPNRSNLTKPFEQQFAGMTTMAVTVTDLDDTRSWLIADLRARIDPASKAFLLGLHDGAPDFALIDRPGAAHLPAVQWKLSNLRRFADTDPVKHGRQREALEVVLDTPIAPPSTR